MREKRMITDVARKRDPDTLYKFPKQILTAVDVMDEVVEDRTVREILDAETKVQADLAALEAKVGYFVRNAGVKRLEDVVVIHPKKEYVVVTTDEQGYIKDSALLSQKASILPGQPTPDGTEFRYHKVEEGKIIEDEERKRHTYRLM